MSIGLLAGSYGADGFRTCGVTGLRIHRSAEVPVKLFGLTAVVALIIGGTAALLVALTRWELVGLLDPVDFYKFLSLHAWNLLIFHGDRHPVRGRPHRAGPAASGASGREDGLGGDAGLGDSDRVRDLDDVAPR